MDSSGGNQKQLAPNIGIDSYPTVTPDGRYVAFASQRTGAFEYALWRMDVDGSNRRQLTLGAAPTCSPDGRWIVYGQSGRLWKIGIDGGSPVQLTDFRADLLSISPDGKQVAYYSTEGPHLGLIPFDGGPATKIVELTPSSRSINQVPRWTPDGRALAYIDRRGGVGNIWSVPISGGQPQQLTYFTSDEVYAFAWSRDGQWLAMSRGNQTTDVVLISEIK
jgi:Tol biopolymer transport system component